MALYFVRHGESESNERNLFAGRFDTPLTALGRRQALQAKARVESRGLRFDEVVSTPLGRAYDTACLIINDDSIMHTREPDLVERDFGKLSEQNKSLIKKYFGAHEFENMFHTANGAPPDGESFRMMYARVKKYYDTVLVEKDRAGKVVLVVAHKYIIEMFVLIAAGLTSDDYHDFRVPNCKPLSFDDLRACVDSTSPKLNHFAERIEAGLAPLLFGAAVLGGAIRLFVDHAIPTALFTALMLILLAINSGFALLRLESQVVVSSFASLRRIWKGFLPRYIVGFLLIVFGHGEIAFSIGAFLLLPPAMTAPTLSLAWGGDYFLSSQATLVSTLISPVLLGLAAFFSFHESLSVSKFSGYFFALLFAIGGPALIAQMFRRRDPIRAGALTTNWGWIGAGVMIPLAFLASYEFFPSRAEMAQATLSHSVMQIAAAAGLFALLRLFASVSSLVKSSNARANLDRYITHIAPNIFFWFSLLPITSSLAVLRFAVTFLFFASILIEEKRIVRQFPRVAGLTDQEILCSSQPLYSR